MLIFLNSVFQTKVSKKYGLFYFPEFSRTLRDLLLDEELNISDMFERDLRVCM